MRTHLYNFLAMRLKRALYLSKALPIRTFQPYPHQPEATILHAEAET